MSGYGGSPGSKHRFNCGTKKDDAHDESLSGLYLAILAMLSSGLLILANFLGAKIWHLGPIILDGGVIIFPLIYIASDLLVELFGAKTANRIAIGAAILNLVSLIACTVANLLPGLPDAENVDLVAAFGLSTRVLLASSVAFLLSTFLNNFLFEKIREHRNAFWKRALGSSFFARIIDTTVFSVIAFAGRTSFSEMIGQIFWSFLIGMILESIVCPITSKIANTLERRILKQYIGKIDL